MIRQWHPTTISQTTFGRIVDLAQRWNVRVGNIILPTPPDGNSSLCSILACKKRDSWRHHRSALGFLSNRLQEQMEKKETRNTKNALIAQYEQLGNTAEANRLRLSGSEGYPDIESVPILAEMFGLRIQLHSLTFDDAPAQTFGEGTVVHIGHMMLLNTQGVASGHFVALRDTEPEGSYGVPLEVAISPGTCVHDVAHRRSENDNESEYDASADETSTTCSEPASVSQCSSTGFDSSTSDSVTKLKATAGHGH